MLNIPKRKVPKQTINTRKEIGNIARKARAESLWEPLVYEEISEAFIQAADTTKPFSIRLKKFLLAENKSGRRAKLVKDFALFFIPWGKQVQTASNFLLEEVYPEHKQKQEQVQKDMERIPKAIKWMRNRLKEKSTRTALLVIASMATFFGVEMSAMEITAGIEGVLQAVSMLIASLGVLYELVRKEKEDEEEDV